MDANCESKLEVKVYELYDEQTDSHIDKDHSVAGFGSSRSKHHDAPKPANATVREINNE